MPIDWSALLSPQARVRLRATAIEMARLHALPDRWLGEEILKLARAVRLEFPEKLSDPHGGTYEPNLVWQVVPELAKRLGATRLLPNEATSRDVVTLSDSICAGLRTLPTGPTTRTFLRLVPRLRRWNQCAGD